MGHALTRPNETAREALRHIVFKPPDRRDEMRRLASACDAGRKERMSWVRSEGGVRVSLVSSPPPLPLPQQRGGRTKKWIVWAHGNACCVREMLPVLRRFQDGLGVGFAVFDYQGYGCSEGRPTEAGCVADLAATVHHLRARFGVSERDILLVGQSLGTGVVVEFAHAAAWEQPVVLISPFTSVCGVAGELVARCCSSIDMLRTASRVGDLRCRVKVVHGTRDRVVPLRHGVEVVRRAGDQALPPAWVLAGHNDVAYAADLRHFESLLRPSRPPQAR